jgi:hypothetical protein
LTAREINNHLSALTSFVGVVQGGLGAMMLFLIGLALRNRFRLK